MCGELISSAQCCERATCRLLLICTPCLAACSADSYLLIDFLSSSNHPYEVAETISLPINQGNPPYLKWIGDIVPE